MKNEKGITLVTLVITIILMMILATVSVYTGIESYENMQVQAFIAKMKTVQEAVDKLCEEYTIQEINTKGLPASSATQAEQEILAEVISEGEAGNLKCWYEDAGDSIDTNYRYFSTNEISTILGIKDFDTAIFFNPRTRNIIAVNGVEYDDKIYYRQYDLIDGQTLPDPKMNSNFSLDNKVIVKTFDNKAVIYLNFTDNTKVKSLEYCKKIGESSYDAYKVSKDLTKITVYESGTYKIKATSIDLSVPNNDSNIGQEVEDIEGVNSGINEQESSDINIVIVNKPLLVDGMTPIKMTSNTSYEEISSNDENWYNYGEQKWANAKLKDGSVYVWIPRYAYKIDDSSNPPQINIDFLKDISPSISTTGNFISSGYKVEPAFQDGNSIKFVNGEWDSELYGFWVAKYETSEGLGDDSGKIKNILDATSDITSWRGLTPYQMFIKCREMETLENYYFNNEKVPKASGVLKDGVFAIDENNIDTHLMKNSEWGAVAYLTYSKYGGGFVPDAIDSYSIRRVRF